MSSINRFLYEPPGGQFREFVGISTTFEPNDLTLYQKLIPKPFSMPEKPLIFAFVADYMKVARWPLTRYQEWSIGPICSWNGRTGWYCLTMPVTNWVAMKGGRNLGFPKYIVDRITFTRINQGWQAKSIYKGTTQVIFDFKPGLTRSLTSWEEELMADPSFFKINDQFLFLPPSKGPRIQRVSLEYVIPAQWSQVPGMVHIEVDQNEAWAGLIAMDNSFPGTYNHFVGGVNIIVLE
jgi:hypothetical protein